MKKAWIVALVIALVPSAAGAVTASEARRKLEHSLLVKGEIETDAQGDVSSVTVEKPEKFPPGLVDYVTQQVSRWKFEPVLVEGKPMRARSVMSLLVVATKLPNKQVSIGIRNASFGRQAPKPGEYVSSLDMKPPVYPRSLAAKGVSGTVYVLLKVGRDGSVQDAAVEKVNLRVLAKEHVMQSWRETLSEAALEALRTWRFSIRRSGNTPTIRRGSYGRRWISRCPTTRRSPWMQTAMSSPTVTENGRPTFAVQASPYTGC